MANQNERLVRLLTRASGLALAGWAALAAAPKPAAAQEDAKCLSPDPSVWPKPQRPYFLVVVDTSGSMAACTNPATAWPQTCADVGGGVNNSCGWQPLRVNDAKCALRNTIQAFAGEANFGLASFSRTISGCPAACNWGEFWTGSSWYRYAYNGCSFGGSACGGANMLVGMVQDQDPPLPNNVASMLQYMDHNCGDQKELFAYDATPIGASLQNARTYFQSGLPGFPSPLTAADRACRSLNVILMTDGGETCSGDPVTAAQQLYNGFTKDGLFRRIYTHVIAFNVDAPADQTLLNNVHKMGQCGTTTGACASAVNALPANNEVTLSQAFATIISGAIKPEVCNNADDNCNGCTDEGYAHYCNQRTDCCTQPRATCLSQYTASITPSNPQGDLTKLPCVTSAQSSQPLNWLCYNPTEQCNNADDNCNGQTDEGVLKCGNPPHCPTAEVCNNEDDNCDGVIDNAAGSGVPFSACPNNCQPSPEICDGCDNDCDGVADDGVAAIPCGFSPPGNCTGTQSCQSTGQAVPIGGCVGAGVPKGFGTCVNNPQTEICDGIDNNCNGTVDEGIAPTTCTIPGQPGLVYKDTFPPSQCVKGQLPCNGTCSGWIGPSAEICDGIDNDCDGVVDDGVPGVGQACGVQGGICTKGTTACVGGVLVCQGGTPPQPESCNGIDDDCDGQVDDAPLTDQPAQPGCWNLPATGCNPVCSHSNVQWCPPAGGTCTGTGTLTTPCQAGSLVCNGNQGWKCQGGKTPSPEVCDGVDNDCDGTKDDNVSGVGQTCGNTTPPCQPGLTACVNGTIECQGGVKPTPEVCNAIDDDCNGTVDDGLGLGGPCAPTYDTTLYPGDRTKGQCKPGVSQCDTQGSGQTVCVGGVGPSPEICDGIDNDCDGQTDEPGPAPDGIDGTANPSNPNQKIGDACGTDEGECQKGQLICDNGKFACANGIGPQPEKCDCLDNDCDGNIDEDAPDTDAGELPICSPGKSCVALAAGVCQCAAPCKGEICPGGAVCETVTKSGTTETGKFCVNDPCGDCSKKTVKDPTTGEVVCGPGGSGAGLPECKCKGDLGCQSPCFGVQCPSGQACAPTGPAVGTCQPQNNCNFFGCKAGEICSNSACVDDPCDPNTCQAGEVCKPNETFTEPRCVKSCASVTCQAGEKCVEGECKATGCGQDCPTGQVCAPAGDASFSCAPDKCQTEGGLACSNGSYCDPATGACGNDPCTGVKCPSDAEWCQNGECVWKPETGTGGTGGTSGTGGGGAGGSGAKDGGAASGGTAGTAGSAGSGEPPKGVWGLATGGGGCACRATGSSPRQTALALLMFAAAIGAAGLRRRQSKVGNQ
ncbi:MAG: hypothetical protein HS104_28355 [Polyangiaceae bacterium]|nr:hypothetical protein [Polyangiaceae bacterium]